jgi:hypothetical protein
MHTYELYRKDVLGKGSITSWILNIGTTKSSLQFDALVA